ncbi:Myo-inositol 2-dehydrogenase [hydrothermal vent metagenome]|uniref:Myo-inositol 2-dehydrogenase n=1 Tax=hydrothermal vent metagenome TaxID=652676 RepID=A0A3B0SNH7_9ZZZZ
MTRIRVGLLGYGLAGSVFHAPLICAEPTLELVVIASRRKEAIAGALPHVEAVPSPEEVIERRDIDLIIVATPNDAHFPQASAALAAGKHVVVDKPMALNVSEADALISHAAEAHRLLTVFHNRRWDNGFLTLRQAIADGALGEVCYFESRFDRFRPAIKQGWREQPGEGAGVLYDLGAHLVDQAMVLFGLPDAVEADVMAQRTEARVDDYFHIVLHFGRRRAVLHAATLARMPGPSLVVHGNKGSFMKFGLDGQEADLKTGLRPGNAAWGANGVEDFATLDDGAGPKRVPLLSGDYPAFYRGVAASIRDGARPLVAAEEGRDVMRVLAAARQSAADGRRIMLAGLQ